MNTLEEAIIREAERWFRAVLRLERLEPYEQPLFEAIASLRIAKNAKGGMPPAPKAPNIEGPFPDTLKDFPRPFEDYPGLEPTTMPIPADVQEDLVLESVLKELDKKGPR